MANKYGNGTPWSRQTWKSNGENSHALLKETKSERHQSDAEHREAAPLRASSRDMELTEMAVPPPARRISNPFTGIEAAQLEARRTQDPDAGLAEIAAPSPLENRDAHFDSSDGADRTTSKQDHGDLQHVQSQNREDRKEDRQSLSSSSEQRKSIEDQPAPPPLPAQGPPDGKWSRALYELYTLSWLTFFSLLGTLARLGVEAITLYPNSPVTSRVLWANLGGSFFMGFLAEDRRLFREEWGSPDPRASLSRHGKIKKTIPLYIGLATGFCGSFTSFSSFIRDCFLAMSNDLAAPSATQIYDTEPYIASRDGGFSFLALLAIFILHPAVSLAALKVGAQFALFIQPITPTIPLKFARNVLDPLAILLGWGAWIGAILLSIFPPGNADHWRARATLSLTFAPVGCLMRFYVSKFLNARIPSFPLGTFTVNIFGTMVLGMAYDLQHYLPYASTQLSCAFLYGLQEGFCGCLTTVSTWVAELSGLKRRAAWIYGLTSVGVAFGFMTAIMGGMAWTAGFASPVCT